MASCTLIGGLPPVASPSGNLDRYEQTRTSVSVACVTSPSNYRSARTTMARNAGVSCRLDSSCNARDLCSSFWSKDSLGRLRSSHENLDTFPSRVSRPVPQVVARLFGPAIFEASKLRVLFLGKEKEKGQLEEPRIYTLTHSDTTAKITLAVAQEINKAQLRGWYSKLQRDEVLAEWRKTQGEMQLHVHCHISGGNWLHNIIAKLRFYIFRKELPVVLEAFLHGDRDLFAEHPELRDAPVWVYFHSNMPEYNRLESWGPLSEATKGAYKSEIEQVAIHQAIDTMAQQKRPGAVCSPGPCECCSSFPAVIPVPDTFRKMQSSEESQQRQSPEMST